MKLIFDAKVSILYSSLFSFSLFVLWFVRIFERNIFLSMLLLCRNLTNRRRIRNIFPLLIRGIKRNQKNGIKVWFAVLASEEVRKNRWKWSARDVSENVERKILVEKVSSGSSLISRDVLPATEVFLSKFVAEKRNITLKLALKLYYCR